MYAELMGNHKNHRIKSLWDNKWAEIADEDLYGVTIAQVNNIDKQWKDYGYYSDENGVKRYGVIPEKQIQWAGVWRH